METHKKDPFAIHAIPKVDVFRSVLEQLERYISESNLAPGTRLPAERELCKELGVSRVSLREALRALESMGIIEIRRNAGSYVREPAASPITLRLLQVAPVSLAYLDDLVAIRAALEDRVVKLLGDVESFDLTETRQLLNTVELELGEGGGEQGSLDLRFEAALARQTGNPLLEELVRAVHAAWIEAWTSQGVKPGNSLEFHREHKHILTALESGDINAARHAVANHVDRSVARRTTPPTTAER